MRFACDRIRPRNVCRFFRRADAENWRLPLVALGCKLLVLGRLGRDTARQFDLREDGVLLGVGNVGFLIRDNILRHLFGLREAVPRGSDVPLVDVLNILGVGAVLRIDLGLRSLAVDFVENTI